MSLSTECDHPEVVTTESLERELHRVRASAAGACEGVFGPQSLTWQINRESAIFFGAGRALLLQLAHPWVAAAIDQHSDAFADPIGRFHRTFQTVFAMVFGTLDQSVNAARRLHRRHASITGQLPWTTGPYLAGSAYRANAIPALRWVYATLIHTALVAYELVLPPLTTQQREQYYRESKLFAGLFGIRTECLPQEWTAFLQYFSRMVESDVLSISDRARTLAHQLISGSDLWLPVPISYQNLTIALLPSTLRRRFDLPFGEFAKRRVEHAIAMTRRLYPILPAHLRYVGPFQEAEQRLAGRPAPDLAVRMCNRFWIGRAALP
jgi:uncharacterized protein (DUF2236 family)